MCVAIQLGLLLQFVHKYPILQLIIRTSIGFNVKQSVDSGCSVVVPRNKLQTAVCRQLPNYMMFAIC